MLQIHEVSGGNPFYALELARAMDDGSTDVVTSLPGTLAGLVQVRIGRLTPTRGGRCSPPPVCPIHRWG